MGSRTCDKKWNSKRSLFSLSSEEGKSTTDESKTGIGGELQSAASGAAGRGSRCGA
jgi:hypothetical protein